MATVEITDDNFENTVLKADKFSYSTSGHHGALLVR